MSLTCIARLADRSPRLPYARLSPGFRPAGDAGSQTVASSHLMQLALVVAFSAKSTISRAGRCWLPGLAGGAGGGAGGGNVAGAGFGAGPGVAFEGADGGVLVHPGTSQPPDERSPSAADAPLSVLDDAVRRGRA